MIRFILAAILFSAPAAAQAFPCPYTYPGPPEAMPCPVEQPAAPSCLAHARLHFWSAWVTRVVPAGNQRCFMLDDIANMQLEQITLIEAVDDAYFWLISLDEDCINNVPGACELATSTRAWIALTEIEIAGIIEEVVELNRWVDIYEASMTSHLSTITANFHAEVLACCGAGSMVDIEYVLDNSDMFTDAELEVLLAQP